SVVNTMRLHMRIAVTTLVLICAAAVSTQLALGKKKDTRLASQLEDRKRAQQALNRLTFGARPGDINHVLAIGVDQWIDQQLHPEKIDDSAVETRLAPLRTLKMDTHEIVNFLRMQLLVDPLIYSDGQDVVDIARTGAERETVQGLLGPFTIFQLRSNPRIFFLAQCQLGRNRSRTDEDKRSYSNPHM